MTAEDKALLLGFIEDLASTNYQAGMEIMSDFSSARILKALNEDIQQLKTEIENMLENI